MFKFIKKHHYPLLFVLMLIMMAAIIYNGVKNFTINFAGYPWTMDKINDYLESPIPTDAEGIQYDGHRGRGGGLELSFEAPSQSMDDFVSAFCDGLLYPNYDPFNAIDTVEPSSDAYLITMGNSTPYYSYSPDVFGNVSGIRCLSHKNGQVQIAVSKISDERSFIRMELLASCYKCFVPRDES